MTDQSDQDPIPESKPRVVKLETAITIATTTFLAGATVCAAVLSRKYSYSFGFVTGQRDATLEAFDELKDFVTEKGLIEEYLDRSKLFTK